LQAVLRYPRRPAFGPSRFDVALADPGSAGGRIIRSQRCPCGFSALYALCARPTPRDLCHGAHRPGLGHSPRSLFRAAFRYPVDRTLSRPGRVDFNSTRQRSWDFSCPSQFSLAAGPRISAVHPHLPLSVSFAREPANFYGLPVAHFSAPSRRDDSKSDRRRERSDRLLGHAAAGKLNRCAFDIEVNTERTTGQSCHGLLALLSGMSDAFSQHAYARACSSSSLRQRRQPPQPYLLWAAIRSWVL